MPESLTETLRDPDDSILDTTALSYTYDSLGNIITVSEGGTQRQKYYYDNLNQLIREDNLDFGKTIVYTYDLGGNLLSTEEYVYQTGETVTGTPVHTDTYSYTDSSWKDKLTSYNGNSITYDAIGNPLSYYNGFSFTWEKGRVLSSAANGTYTVTYQYDHEGNRKGKTVNGVTHAYMVEGGLVKYERTPGKNLWYYYDAGGSPIGMALGNPVRTYIYRKNLQGDVTGIISGETGELLVSYTYDAWGKPEITDEAHTTESAELIERNCLLYRGCFYDHETGLYYLRSRYYDPETGRFLNADSLVSTGQGMFSTNMFAYCENNPVMQCDPSGYMPIRAFAVMMTDCGGHGGKTVTTTRDVTEEVDNALRDYVKLGNAISQGNSFSSPHFITPSPIEREVVREVVKYSVFYELVNHDAPWDIKKKDSWKNTIGTSFPGDDTVIKYHNLYLVPEELGNYTYGILGREFGIPLEILFVGSYYAAHFPTSGDAFNHEVFHDWRFITLGYYGDH